MLVKIRTNKKTRNKSKKYIAFIIKNMYNKFTKNIILVKKGECWKEWDKENETFKKA